MAQCNITDLLNRGKCFECLTPGEIFPIKLALLCSIAQARIPGYDCSVNTLLRNASCFLCLPYPMQKILKLQLLCKLVGPPTPPPVTGFQNAAVSLREDCAGGANLGLPACVTINSGVYTSQTSQADADNQATTKANSLLVQMDTGHCCNGGPAEIGDFTWPNSGGGASIPPNPNGSFTFNGNPSPGSASGSATQNPGEPVGNGMSIVWKQLPYCSAWDAYVGTVSFDYVVAGVGPNSTAGWLIDFDNGTDIRQEALSNGSGHRDISYTIQGTGGGHGIQIEFTANTNNAVAGPVSIVITNLVFRPNVPPVTSNCTVVANTNPPANDNFANAQTISGASGTVNGSNVFATVEPGEPGTAAGAPVRTSIWYNWTAPSNGTASFNTWGSNYDTVLAVYTGAAVNALTQIAANDDGTRPLQSNLSFAAVSGTTYRIRVDGFDGASGNVTLTWSLV